MKTKLLIILLILIFFPLINADVISVNSGGDEGLIINPHELIEGFFSDIPTIGAICGNGVLESGEGCDDGNTVSGDGCSATCTVEAPVTPPGGGGGVAGPDISLDPSEFNINLAVNTTTERTVKIINHDASSVTVAISQSNLDQHILLGTNSITIPAQSTEEFKVTFVAGSEPGIYTGRIIVGNMFVTVSLNVRTKLLLFDSNIVVLNENYQVEQGKKLRTQVTLIPMGEKERMDVNLYYVIKDYQGNTYLTRSETVLIDDRMDFNRNFGTGNLPLGKYIIGLELVYPNGVAPSSAHFEVIERKPWSLFAKIVFFLIILIIIVLILIIIFLIKRERDKKKQQQGVS